MADRVSSYLIETDIPSSYFGNLINFIYQKYVMPELSRFTNVSNKATSDNPSLAFTLLGETGQPNLNVEIKGSNPVELTITRLDESVSEEMVNRVRQDVTIVVDFFDEQVRKSTLYFAWREGEEIVPEQLRGNEKKPIQRIFLETQILFFIIFIAISFFLFAVIGLLTPIVLLAIQFVFVLYSSKIIARAADWRITKGNPDIHILEYHLPLEEHDKFRQKFSRAELIELKKEIYNEAIADKGEVDCETVHQIFLKSGIQCKPENLATRKVDVYNLVEQTAKKFGYPLPEIVVSNTELPNAAASGPSPSRGVVLITTGLFVQLDDEEIISVLGHEFGHLKGHDTLLLYGLSAIQYLFSFYVLWSFLYSSILLFLVYFWAVMAVIYFIAKFFEARADLISAIVIGQPQLLARALEKIGFKRLLYERVPSYRVQEWISFDPHPPIYFRVNRLDKLQVPVKIKHPLIQSAKDVTRGFLASL
ncbi:MAG TPA: M48 family metallopeptidase [Candidatus Krumholzibacteriaceae bacterium]|nr:M48 family metallopeptidase [Candidatus Krumholzibacteriaceae bacterium]